MAVGVIVGSELGLNIGQRNIASDANVHSIGNLSPVQIHVSHHRVVTVLVVLCQQLLAEIALRGGKAVIQSVQLREAESPVEMVDLNRIGNALNVKRGLL